MWKPQDVLVLREKILHDRQLRLLRVFDTFEKTNGAKDVILCEPRTTGSRGRTAVVRSESQSHPRAILRIGEQRPVWFFSNGYFGKYLRIPKQFESGSSPIPWELEECLEGPFVFEVFESHDGTFDPKLLERLLHAFWEFQRIGRALPLEQKFTIEKILKHFEGARPLFPNAERIHALILENDTTWAQSYPSKWKFATDNLILLPDGTVGFIDNVNVGARFFWYDLGWLIWPRWFIMTNENYSRHDEHAAYLASILETAIHLKPVDVPIPSDIEHCFWLMIFERLVGATFDVANNTRHLAHWGMGPMDPPERRKKHLEFLQALMEIVIRKL